MTMHQHPEWSQLSTSHQRRYERTRAFLDKTLHPDETILDVGSENPFSRLLKADGYTVHNSHVDLDRHPGELARHPADVVTAFEILEHLLNPLGVLENLPGKRLYASVPMRLWFSNAYRNPDDPWDRHFHEFESWQFDWLLDHAGWTIIRSEKWTNPVRKFGIRPLLRFVTPRWYVIEAIRKDLSAGDR
ncbi:MAG: hypothetical protein WD115_06725 [Balneolaceae bacterium]